jgi:hypothetical protein
MSKEGKIWKQKLMELPIFERLEFEQKDYYKITTIANRLKAKKRQFEARRKDKNVKNIYNIQRID